MFKQQKNNMSIASINEAVLNWSTYIHLFIFSVTFKGFCVMCWKPNVHEVTPFGLSQKEIHSSAALNNSN